MTTYELTPFRRLLDQIVPRARLDFRRIFPSIGITLTLAGGVYALVQIVWMTRFSQVSSPSSPAVFLVMTGMFLAVLVFAIVNMLAFTALSVASMDALSGRGVDMGRAWRVSFRGRVLWTLLLSTILYAISFVMCLVPALLVWPLLSLTLPVMIIEEKYGSDAIRRSAQMTWWNGTGRMADSNFLQVSALMLAGWLIHTAVTGLVQAPLALLQQYVMLREAAGGGAEELEGLASSVWLQVPTQMLSTLASSVALFFWTFGYGMLYFEFERRRHGTDLRQAIDELTAADSLGLAEPEVS